MLPITLGRFPALRATTAFLATPGTTRMPLLIHPPDLDETYMQPIVKTIQLADDRTITLETGKLAKQADGSVVVRMGNTMLLATVVAKKEPETTVEF